METKKHIVIYSHGTGVRKDDRGLFTYLADGLPEVESILFDYNIFDEATNTLMSRTIKEHADMLSEVVNETRLKNPDAIIDIIAHSQGCNVAALADPKGIRKSIFTAPVFDMDINRTLDRYRGKPGTVIDLEGTTTFLSSDGYIKAYPAEYWRERQALKPFDLYNNFAHDTELILINANQDHILGAVNLDGLSNAIKVMSIDGDHEFSGEARQGLLKAVRDLVLGE